MKKTALAVAGLAILSLIAVSGQPQSGNQLVASASAERALLNQYCVVCHNEKAKAQGAEPARKLTLDNLDVAHVEQAPAEWATIVRKLRAGMMPPPGLPRPNPATYEAMSRWLENELARTAVQNLPPPGLHRLNRTE